jgi:hypothetical protein
MGLTSRSTVLRLRKARSTFARPCIGADGRGGIERLGPEVGAQDIDAVEQGFGFDLLDLALERQIIVGRATPAVCVRVRRRSAGDEPFAGIIG